MRKIYAFCKKSESERLTVGVHPASYSPRREGNAHVAQLVERILGKDEVVSSILTMSSTPLSANQSRDVAQSGSALEWGSRGR